MKIIAILFIFFSASVFSQDIEYNKAQDFLNRNKIDSASIVIQKVLKKDKKNNSKIYLLYSKILKNNNRIDSSYYYLDLSEKDFLKRNVNDSLIYTYALKAELFRFALRKKESLSYLNKIDLFGIEKVKNYDIKAYSLNRKMGIYNHLCSPVDTLKSVIELGNEILKLEKNVVNKDIIAYTLNELALIEYHHGNPKLGLKKFQEALEYAVKKKLIASNIDIHMNFATVCFRELNDSKKAISLLENILPLAEKNKNLQQIFNLYEQLSGSYAYIHDYKKAYYYKCKSHDTFLESNADIVSTKLTEIEKKFNIANKEKEIKEKESEIKLKNIQINNNQKRLVLFLIIFVLSLIGVASLLYFLKKSRNQNRVLINLSNDNKFLLSEANHRINNNLQLITILIADKIKKIPKEQQVEINEILSKVDAIATLHRHLYKSNEVSKINVHKYLNDIYFNFNTLFNYNNISSHFHVDEFKISTDNAMYLGLLLTELYINSIKHAFKNQDNKEIQFELKVQNNEMYFKYSDNGNQKLESSIKPKLVDKLCRQLKLEYEINVSKGFSFSFKQNC
jgi:two-component sensor histidine kinase